MYAVGHVCLALKWRRLGQKFFNNYVIEVVFESFFVKRCNSCWRVRMQ